jgi:hypothetical protein
LEKELEELEVKDTLLNLSPDKLRQLEESDTN